MRKHALMAILAGVLLAGATAGSADPQAYSAPTVVAASPVASTVTAAQPATAGVEWYADPIAIVFILAALWVILDLARFARREHRTRRHKFG